MNKMIKSSKEDVDRGCSTHVREKRNSCKIFVGNTEGTRSLGRFRFKCDDDIKIDLN